MPGYYSTALAGARLKLCYDLAPPRVQQYLSAEIEHATSLIRAGETVLELGCGYGRILKHLARAGQTAIGIDTSLASLQFGGPLLADCPNAYLVCADASLLPFPDGAFDRVFCLQNGISAFKVASNALLTESLRVLRSGGAACFSTYSERFWSDRLEWFRIQSEAGLVGPIDEEKTGHGVIVCTDGFSARTATRDEFERLAGGCEATCHVHEVDRSSLFAEFRR